MLETICPMSLNSNVLEIDSLSVQDIIHLYQKCLGIDISSELLGLDEIRLYHCLTSDLVFFEPAITGSEKFYEKLQAYPNYYANEKDEHHYASRWIRETDKVLEIGCGEAAFANHISCAYYRGLEFSPVAVEIAMQKGWEVAQDSIQNHTNTHSEYYDVVCAFQVLEHVSEVSSFIDSSIQCLKTGGILIYSTPSSTSFINEIPNFILDMPPHHVTRWSDRALLNIGEFYPLNSLEIWHEPLQKYHINLYLETKIRTKLYKIFRKSNKRINTSLTHKFLTLFIQSIVKLFPYKNFYANSSVIGHTVVSVYQKPDVISL